MDNRIKGEESPSEIPEDLQYALETVTPEVRHKLLETWENLTDSEKKFCLWAINLEVSQEHFYEARRKQMGL